MKLEAGWWFGKMDEVAMAEDSEKAAKEVQKEAEQLAQKSKKFPDNLSDKPKKNWLMEWEEKHS